MKLLDDLALLLRPDGYMLRRDPRAATSSAVCDGVRKLCKANLYLASMVEQKLAEGATLQRKHNTLKGTSSKKIEHLKTKCAALAQSLQDAKANENPDNMAQFPVQLQTLQSEVDRLKGELTAANEATLGAQKALEAMQARMEAQQRLAKVSMDVLLDHQYSTDGKLSVMEKSNRALRAELNGYKEENRDLKDKLSTRRRDKSRSGPTLTLSSIRKR